MKEKLLKLNLYLGLFGIAVSSILLIQDSAFMKTWFYIFAWWSLILIIDSLNFRKSHSSPLSESVKDFVTLAFISVFIWLLFELFNLRLRNWSYHSLPSSPFERWLGYFLAFATVVPALKELSTFFQSRLEQKKMALFRVSMTPCFLKVLISFGIAALILPLSWPRFFFPLIWLSFLILVDPLNFRLKNDSLLKDFKNDDWIRFWSWILAGLSAGFLWESFNFWAGSHWEYHLPYFDFWKVFQMPVLGYFGFLPFALEVFALLSLILSLKNKLQGKPILQFVVCLLFLVFYVISFMYIDRFTVIHRPLMVK